MAFTEEDLKRLKDGIGPNADTPQVLWNDQLAKFRALLTRLECAEACAKEAMELLTDNPSYTYSMVKSYEAWRKSKGA
jgi:hypothetical protein